MRPTMSKIVAGSSTTLRPVTSLENSPSSWSWVSGFGRTGGASPTLVASVSKSGAHCDHRRPKIT